ncbi:ATP phosphoribosyltransferase [bioreactor metagenome]|uniref:ATP phosphoribosyltransferase n=1 Tax=bioreactor metagenome TaxID=1076179 RepID=A0A644TG06_9ZZZZ|nr:ATP phosphoribosyltransferase [Negativicutes bacterium]
MTSSDLNYLTVALPKGKLFAPSAKMLADIGYTAEGLSEKSRKLVITNEEEKIRFIITKTADLPTYVEYGAADVGIIGKDVLLEEGKDVYELLDLKFGFCRLMVAVPQALQQEKLSDYAHMRVATKYPRVAERFFSSMGIQMEIIKLNGSIELAPMVGLAEMIVDIVETGRTLKENQLIEVAQIHPATARFIANRVSFKMKFDRINRMVEDLKTLMEGGVNGENSSC